MFVSVDIFSIFKFFFQISCDLFHPKPPPPPFTSDKKWYIEMDPNPPLLVSWDICMDPSPSFKVILWKLEKSSHLNSWDTVTATEYSEI